MTEKAKKPQGVRAPRIKFGGTGVYTPPPASETEPKVDTEKDEDDGQRPED